jgi:hypothetical protein
MAARPSRSCKAGRVVLCSMLSNMYEQFATHWPPMAARPQQLQDLLLKQAEFVNQCAPQQVSTCLNSLPITGHLKGTHAG